MRLSAKEANDGVWFPINMSRAVFYVRVSPAEQAEGQSIEAQLEKLRESIQRHADSVVGEFGDPGFPGDTQERPGLRRMFEAACERRFDVLLVSRFDRLFSDVRSFLNAERQLRQHGVRIISITEPVDDTTEGLPEPASKRSVVESEEIGVARGPHQGKGCATQDGGGVGRPSPGCDQEEMQQVRQLINEYLDHLHYNLNYAPTTVRHMRLTFTHVCRYWGDLTKYTSDMIEQKKMEMLKAEKNVYVTKRVIMRVVGFLEWAHHAKDIPVEADFGKLRANLRAMRLPRQKHKVEYLTREAFDSIVGHLDTDKIADLRLRALLEVLFGTGLRISEALALNRDTIKPERFTIIGKGRKERTVYITQRGYAWVQRYLAERTDNEPAVFVGLIHAAGASPRRLKYNGLFDQFEKFRAERNLPEWFTFHTLRRSVATILYLETHDITLSRDVLGHENVATTDKYYRGVDEEVTLRRFRRAVEPVMLPT